MSALSAGFRFSLRGIFADKENMHPSWDSELPLTANADRRRARKWRKGLTMEQHYALHRYADQAYRPLNENLRGQEVEDARKASVHDTCLREIPAFAVKEPMILWRGTYLPENLRVKGSWTDPAWVSCSFDKEHAKFAAKSGEPKGALMQFLLEEGCEYIPLSFALRYTEKQNEHEILLTPGHRFRIEKVSAEFSVVRVWSAWDL